MTKFRFTYKNIENAFAAMLKNSAYETWYELFDRETFEAEFAEFIGTTEEALSITSMMTESEDVFVSSLDGDVSE